jgi:hypothetical protein
MGKTIQEIAEQLGCSVEEAQREMDGLVDMGLVEEVEEGKDGVVVPPNVQPFTRKFGVSGCVLLWRNSRYDPCSHWIGEAIHALVAPLAEDENQYRTLNGYEPLERATEQNIRDWIAVWKDCEDPHMEPIRFLCSLLRENEDERCQLIANAVEALAAATREHTRV